MKITLVTLATLLTLLAIVALGESPESVMFNFSSASADEPTAILVGAGDIADCLGLAGAEATAKLVEQIPGTVMAIGDLAYPDGSKDNFTCYDKTWGRFKARTRPAVGNHEFHSSGATFYFQYFGGAAGDSNDGYYSYELGEWHIVLLNSECQRGWRLSGWFPSRKVASR